MYDRTPSPPWQELDGLKAQAVNICDEEAKIDGYTTGVLTAMVRSSYFTRRSSRSTARQHECVRLGPPEAETDLIRRKPESTQKITREERLPLLDATHTRASTDKVVGWSERSFGEVRNSYAPHRVRYLVLPWLPFS